MFRKEENDTLNLKNKENNINRLLSCAKYGLLQKPYYVEHLLKNKQYTLEEINEAQRIYDLAKAKEEYSFFKTAASFFDGLSSKPDTFPAEVNIPNANFEKVKLPGTKKISVRAFDFDGCIFNRNYYRITASKRLIEANKELILNTSKNILTEKFDEVVFMVGSNRQSLAVDNVNNKDGTSSCFPALYELCNEFQQRLPSIPCRVDQYLLADTYGKKLTGENFENALKKDNNFNYSHWLFDDSKVTIVYAQIHKIASSSPDHEIIYDFYDDRCGGKDDIINALAIFFGENSDLVPCNLAMRFNYYAGNGVKKVATIKGKGEIDKHFHEHVNLMIHSAGFSFHRDCGKSTHVLSQLGEENLACFKKQRLVKIYDEENKETYYTSEFEVLTDCALM